MEKSVTACQLVNMINTNNGTTLCICWQLVQSCAVWTSSWVAGGRDFKDGINCLVVTDWLASAESIALVIAVCVCVGKGGWGGHSPGLQVLFKQCSLFTSWGVQHPPPNRHRKEWPKSNLYWHKLQNTGLYSAPYCANDGNYINWSANYRKLLLNPNQ